MPKFFVGEQDAQWFDVDVPPFLGDVRVKVKGSTQAVLDRVSQAAKRNPKYRAHHIEIDGKRVSQQANPAAAWSEEFIREVVEDFSGVVDENDQEVPCTDETKLLLMRSPAFINFITDKSTLLAQIRAEEEEKN